MKRIIVAIDGHSSCGKSTMAKDLAKELGYIYIDSGAMYRAVTLYALENNMITADGIREEELRKHMDDIHITFQLDSDTRRPITFLNGRNVEHDIRTLTVSNNVSPIAALSFVREILVRQQQEMGREKGIVMDGRDVGTKVFPDAELKIFVTASPEVRAQRRYDELKAKGDDVRFEDVLKNLTTRDRIDENRAIGPLVQAPDALVLDNSHLTIAEQKAWLMDCFRKVVAE